MKTQRFITHSCLGLLLLLTSAGVTQAMEEGIALGSCNDGLRPMVLKRSTRGTPSTGAAPHIKTASETGSTMKSVAKTTTTGRVTTVTARSPRTPVSVMI